MTKEELLQDWLPRLMDALKDVRHKENAAAEETIYELYVEMSQETLAEKLKTFSEITLEDQLSAIALELQSAQKRVAELENGICQRAFEAKQEQGEPVAWKLLEELPPPIDQALDDASVSSRRRVLVTNNINATNRMGQPSHVWFVSPQRVKKGEWVGFTDSMQKVEALTHWLDPFDTTPQQRKPLTDEQRKKMWHKANPAHKSWASFDWYSQGVADTEAAHGIKE
jgi:hypothetical protein